MIARIGEGQAAPLPTGERSDAERALRIGLVHEVLADELTLDERVAAVVGELLSAGPVAAGAAKAIIRDQRGLPSVGEKRIADGRGNRTSTRFAGGTGGADRVSGSSPASWRD